MSGAPPITIVTPIFNGAAWIGETLESVLAQDYSGELEYIVLDDGSTDGTLDVFAPMPNVVCGSCPTPIWARHAP